MRIKKYVLIVFCCKITLLLCTIILVYTLQSAIVGLRSEYEWLFSPITSIADYTARLTAADKDNRLHDVITVRNERGQTPLMYAIDLDNLERVAALVSIGANPDLLDTGLYEGTSNNTALHRAVYHGDSTNTIPIIDTLLQAGANPRIANDHGSTPLHLTGWITDSINNKNNDVTNKELGRRMQVITLLVDAGADINAQDAQGKTLLHLLVDKRDADFMGQLIVRFSSLINRDVKNNEGLSPIEYATRLFEPEPQDLLSALSVPITVIGADGDIKATDNKGNTGVMLAILRNDKKTVEELLARGANVQIQADNGNTALHNAVLSPNPVLYVTTLLEKKAQPNIRNKAGLIPLQFIPLIVDQKVRYTVFDLLMNAGSDLSVQNKMGDTLLHRAVKDTDRELVERIIKQLGTRIKNVMPIKNNNGHTAYELAQKLEAQEIINLLANYNK